MKYIEGENGFLHISIKFPAQKIQKFNPNSMLTIEYAISKNIDRDTVDEIIQTDLAYKYRESFDKLLTSCILDNEQKIKLTSEELDVQKQEILFIAYNMQQIVLYKSFESKNSEDFRIFTDIATMLKEISQIKSGTRFGLTLSKATSSNLTSIKLPKPYDSSEFYSYLTDAIRRYFVEKSKTFSLKWYLQNAYKEKISSQEMIELNQQISKLKKPHPDNIFGLYMDNMLPYLRRLQQYPPSERQNSILTEAQARFFNKFFRLFGFSNQKFQINISENSRFFTSKDLRVILFRYRND